MNNEWLWTNMVNTISYRPISKPFRLHTQYYERFKMFGQFRFTPVKLRHVVFVSIEIWLISCVNSV